MIARRIARNIGSRAPGRVDPALGSRPLGDESETIVRLLAGAYRVISKQLGESRFSGNAAARGCFRSSIKATTGRRVRGPTFGALGQPAGAVRVAGRGALRLIGSGRVAR